MQAPRFIALGAEVLHALLPDREVHPEFLRRTKLAQCTSDDLELTRLIHQEVTGGTRPTDATSHSLWEEVREVMLREAHWASHCCRVAVDQITDECPHLLGPVLPCPFGPLSPENRNTNQLDTVLLGKVLELQHGRIAAAVREVRALEEERVSKMHDLHLLLRECTSDLAPSALQALLDGALLIDDLQAEALASTPTKWHRYSAGDGVVEQSGEDTLLAEQQRAQDLVANLETDLKCEDVFWKWLLPAIAKGADASTADARNHAHLLAVETMLLPVALQGKLLADEVHRVVVETEAALATALGVTNLPPCAPPGESSFVQTLLQHSALSGATSPTHARRVEASQAAARDAQTERVRASVAELQAACPFTIILT